MALEALNDLNDNFTNSESDVETIQNCLNSLAQAIAEGGPDPRQDVINEDGYSIVIEVWKKFYDPIGDHALVVAPEAGQIREACLKVLYTLTPGHPDIIDDYSFIMILQAFKATVIPESTKIQGLKFMKNICTKSEANREKFVEYEIVSPFVELIKQDENPSRELVREWCGAVRSLVLNDDRRVSYNRSEERKRLIYQNDAHQQLCHFLNIYVDVPTLNSIINAISLMVSHHDFCIAIESSGGLKGIQHVLENYNFNARLMENTMSCLRSINMCPIVRQKCASSTPLLKILLGLIWTNRSNVDFTEIGLGCLAFMTLRCPLHCEHYMTTEFGIHSLIDLILIYIENPFILKNACFILRNLASNTDSTNKQVLIENFGLEEILGNIARSHAALIPNHINHVLKALGLNLINPEPIGPQQLQHIEEIHNLNTSNEQAHSPPSSA